MNPRHVFNERHQFRLVLCGHKAVEVGAVCLVLMVAAVATQLICPVDDPAHLIVGHVVPVAFLSAWGAMVGRRWLDWRHRG